MTPRRRAVLGECEARTQGAFVAGGYGRNRGRESCRPARHGAQGFVLTRGRSLSEDVRGELAAIEPRKACCRLAELSALVRGAGSVHLRGGGRIALHLELASGAGRAAGVLAPALLRRALRDPDVPAARLRAGDALPAPPRGRRARAAGAERGRRSRRQPRAAGAAAPARRRPPLLPGGVPARRVPRRRLGERPAERAPRAAHGGHRLGALPRRARRSRGLRARRLRAEPPRGRLREGRRRRSPTSSRSSAPRTRRCASARRPSSRRRAPARTGSPTPTTPTSCARAGPRTRSSARSAGWSARAGSTSWRRSWREIARLRVRHPTLVAAESSPAAATRRRRRRPPTAGSRASSGSRSSRRRASGPEGKLRGRPPPPPCTTLRTVAPDGVCIRRRTSTDPLPASVIGAPRGCKALRPEISTGRAAARIRRAGDIAFRGGCMSVRVGINGFGRIGRNFFRSVRRREADVEIVAVNDLGDAKTMAHLLKYDSVLGPLGAEVEAGEGVDRRRRRRAEAAERARSGRASLGRARRRRRRSSRPGSSRSASRRSSTSTRARRRSSSRRRRRIPDVTLVLGVNDDAYDPEQHRIISNASCTTNCVAPLAKVLHDAWGIESGFMTTIHAYTNDQQILDLPHKDLRRARAAAINLIPTSTGAAKAIGVVIPELKGKVDGVSVRAPVPDGSLDRLRRPARRRGHGRRGERALPRARGHGRARGDPPLLGRAARLLRHRRQLVLVHLRQRS